jgi:hypothetical protein
VVAELSPEAVALAAEPEVAELSPEAVALAAEPEVAEPSPEVVVLAAEPEVSELSPEVVVLAAEPEVSELSPEVVVLAVEPEVSEPAVVFVGAAGLQASVDIAVAFVVLVPVSGVVVGVDSSGRPKFFAFPNICSFPNCSSSVEVVG